MPQADPLRGRVNSSDATSTVTRSCTASASPPAAGQQLRGDPLRLFFDSGRRLVDERRLAVQYTVDVQAQRRPLGLGKVEIAAEFQQRALTHLGAIATTFHEAMGVVVLAGGAAGEGTADEYEVDGSGACSGRTHIAR